MTKYTEPGNRLMDRAWMRNGDIEVTGEALLLAVLLHAKGRGRQSGDMKEVRRIMRDRNLDRKKK